MAYRLTSTLAALGALLLGTRSSDAAEPHRERGTLFFPGLTGPGWQRVGGGVAIDVMPRRIVESEQRQVPKASLAARYALPGSLFYSGRLWVNVVDNEASLTFGYATRRGRVAMALHERAAFWLGYVGVQGFDTTAWGLVTHPGGSLGLALDDGIRVSTAIEAILVHARHVDLPGATIERRHVEFAGMALTLALEDLLDAGGMVFYGATVSWARPDYQLWLAFEDTEARQLTPTFFAGYGF